MSIIKMISVDKGKDCMQSLLSQISMFFKDKFIQIARKLVLQLSI